jgi:anti-sigma-K factor RskA
MVAEAAEFHVGNIPTGDRPQPDYATATDDDLRRELAQWTSAFDPVYATFLD